MKLYIFKLLLLFSVISLYLFVYRLNYIHPLNIGYLENLYNNSQWMIPASTRIIADDYLYQIAGFRYVNGSDLFSINPEVAPLGKYLIGLSIKYLGSAYYASLLMFFGVVTLFYLIAKKIFHNGCQVFIAVFLLITSPLIFTHLHKTSLDIHQLFWMLLHILAILSIKKHNTYNFYWSILAGLGLGGFVGTKLPAFLPALLIVDTIWLYSRRQLKLLVSIITLTVITYLLIYLPYFVDHHNLIDFIKTQKWIVNFYLSLQVKRYPLILLLVMFTGLFQNRWGHIGWNFVENWSVLWVLGVVIALYTTIAYILKRRTRHFQEVEYIAFLSVLLMMIFIILPSIPRYFILILPLGILLLVRIISKKQILYLLIIAIVQLVMTLWHNPKSDIFYIQNIWQNGNYQDLYTYLTIDSQRALTREQFLQINKSVDQQLFIQHKTVQITAPLFVYPWQNKVRTSLQINYLSQLGEYVVHKDVLLYREGDYWRLNWDWDFIFTDYQPLGQIVSKIDYPIAGNLYTADQVLLSEMQDKNYVSVIMPCSLQRGDLINILLNTIENVTQIWLQHHIFIESDGLSQIDIGYVRDDIDSKLLSSPCLRLSQRPYRYNSQFTIKNHLENRIANIEDRHHELFGKIGGRIVFTEKNSIKKEIFNQLKVDGVNVVLSVSSQDLLENN